MNRFAILADIHGNLLALEAVVADIARRDVDMVINLGDHASGPLWPGETVAFLMQQRWVTISGNCERAVVQQAIADQGASHRYAYEHTTAAQRAWLAELPDTLTVDETVDEDVLLFHGIPSNDDCYLLETVEHGESRLARPSEITARLEGVSAPVMLCAHSHIPRVVRMGNSLIVNPGSVGLPAYDRDQPEPHAMESGAPEARYGLLERTAQGWQVELIALAYEHMAAAEQAKRNARPDWERALRSGFMRE